MVDIAALAPDNSSDDVVDIASLAPDHWADDVVDIASLAPDDAIEVIVDIASLAPDDARAVVLDAARPAAADDFRDVVAIESLAPPPPPRIPDRAPGEPSTLERAFGRRREVQRQRAGETASIAGLIGADIVPITALLYRGTAALVRADEVRIQIRDLLRGGATTLDSLRPHIDELLDLVPLARDAA